MPIPNRDDRTYHPVGLSVEEFRELATSGEVVTLHSGGNVGYDIAVNLNEADDFRELADALEETAQNLRSEADLIEGRE